MRCTERPDDFESRRERLRAMSDDLLHAHFRSLVHRIVEPLVEDARTHTTPAIERSVLLRMGFSSMEAKDLVARMREWDLLGHGAGRLVLELAKARRTSVREAGVALLRGDHWEGLAR